MVESKGFKLSWNKFEYMECKFCNERQRSKESVTVADEGVAQKDQFSLCEIDFT